MSYLTGADLVKFVILIQMTMGVVALAIGILNKLAAEPPNHMSAHNQGIIPIQPSTTSTTWSTTSIIFLAILFVTVVMPVIVVTIAAVYIRSK